ncbi:retinitis pigmentosa 9 protein-like isoform X3 [Myotis lucifugus]|uniref:retinitis pigmentosa 9 protein-like isoform X3 n=1 Tax=Myotis lucifugus TaxID=59463 RepID=UPI000CCC1C10|nr:retinitis pigmentosa 9 protein-like isoform X3 [Myotis lucifugus]
MALLEPGLLCMICLLCSQCGPGAECHLSRTVAAGQGLAGLAPTVLAPGGPRCGALCLPNQRFLTPYTIGKISLLTTQSQLLQSEWIHSWLLRCYEKPPPGLIKEDETKPEDCIPDVPGNEHAREFLAHAPTKGLWMPLGKEVKVMQCWRCKRYGHRTGDKECPFFIKGNQKLEQFRVAHEDPMYDIIRENKRHEKDISLLCLGYSS